MSSSTSARRCTAHDRPLATVTADIAASNLVDGISHDVDVGGGKGTVLAALGAEHPDLRGVLDERQPVLDLAAGIAA